MQAKTNSTDSLQANAQPSFAKAAILKALQGLRYGYLTLTDGQETYTFGDSSLPLHANIVVHNKSFYRTILLRGTVGSGESFIDGHWSSADLAKVVELMVRNTAMLRSISPLISTPAHYIRRIGNLFKRNSKSGSKRNILAHYDLGNDFYKLFLDETMAYSCAIYEDGNEDLYTAQIKKFDTICQRLELKPGETLVEIGTGWGGLAVHAAKHYDVHITTTTISDQQHLYAQKLISSLGLEDKITLLKEDYRDLNGTYDKLVSVEMIEAVGASYLDGYFQKCESLLKPGGKLLIQSITIADQRYDQYRSSVDFIQRYVFPGGFLPSINAISSTLKRKTQLQMTDLHDIGLHYAKTLKQWDEKLLQNKHALDQQGRGNEFYRLWHFYLKYCEGGFNARSISTVHMIAEKPQYG